MTLEQIRAHLGDPVSEETFVADRKTYYFSVGEPEAYRVSCTVQHEGGLIHAVVAPAGMGLE